MICLSQNEKCRSIVLKCAALEKDRTLQEPLLIMDDLIDGNENEMQIQMHKEQLLVCR